MPRIDPIKLLNCLSVLLLPNGGIKGTVEVTRLAEMMTKYSKKLVSKCIYIQILKCTETTLLDLFMASNGWSLVHIWLTESIVGKNWPLVRELIELLLLCPVDIDRLKTNNSPKLVKELSKDENHNDIKALASKLVEQWLKTVKGEQPKQIFMSDVQKIISDIQTESLKQESETLIDEKTLNDVNVHDDGDEQVKNDINTKSDTNDNDESKTEPEVLPVLKITLKNGKQILSQVDDDNNSENKFEIENNCKSNSKEKIKDKRSYDKSRSSSSKYSSRSKSSSKRYHSRNDSSRKKKSKKDTKSHHSKPGSSDSKNKTSFCSHKAKEKKTSHTLELDKERKTINNEKAVSESKPQSPILKAGKTSKLSDIKKEKPSISIEVRKPDDPKPKTVKTFHSKFRKHGLEEEIHPPPSRASVLTKKQLPPLPPTVCIPKRPSPIHNETPPEKKPKTIDIDKPGAIKLIPPKPKPMVLQESDLFMDALNASATNKKEPKKRKRRISGSKESILNESSPAHTPENKSIPPKFYKDTLDEDESKEKLPGKEFKEEEYEEIKNNNIDVDDSVSVSEPHTKTVNGLKGVLCYNKRKGPKKNIKWKPDLELEEIHYFELDETERVNVTKTFTDMKYLEMINEREAFQKARNLTNDDNMEEKTIWKNLILVDCGDQVVVEYGKNSKEKDIQAIHQKGTLQPLYFNKAMIPHSPFEPDLETHTYSEPTPIPLDDVTGNVSDFRNMPWPEPKGNLPANANLNIPPMFSTNIPQFPINFPPIQFTGFQGPEIFPVVPPVMPNGGPLGPPMMAPVASMPPGLLAPPDNMMMASKIFGGPNPILSGPPDGFNIPQTMFPGDFNMPGPQGSTGPGSFSGPNYFRGAMRGRGPNGHWRGTGGFDGSRGRGGNRGGRKAVCIHFQRKGSCRQGDSCSFLHPGVNGPYKS